ncbi:hypothetical protein AB0K16_26815 [Nonomuraea jabiensis]|uniref:hypothetical protein n=1 Tax=Nonomuraea jabiensis TaxID=882448 RepID=UPI003417018C
MTEALEGAPATSDVPPRGLGKALVVLWLVPEVPGEVFVVLWVVRRVSGEAFVVLWVVPVVFGVGVSRASGRAFGVLS